jgi:phenylacetic acid degradation operon negative regulatory protein
VSFNQAIEHLRGGGRLSVWSLIVTFFGDCVAPRGGTVSLRTLQDACAQMGIDAGAVRTSLSRLAAEGWVESRRDGRTAHYSLRRQGLASFDAATKRIYAAGPPAWDGSWTVLLPAQPASQEDRERLASAGFAQSGELWLRPQTGDCAPVPPDLAALAIAGSGQGDAVLAASLWPVAEAAGAFRDLMALVAPVGEALDRMDPSPAQAVALRTLVIHHWRRIVLRSPDLPAAIVGHDWPGEEARRMVARIYGRLLEQSEAWLDEAGLQDAAAQDRPSLRFGALQSSR